jgi:hypothetical protein
MSCDAVASAAMLWLASTSPINGPTAHLTLAVAVAPPSVAGEPLFVDIVKRAKALKAQTDSFRKADLSGAIGALPAYADFKTQIAALSDLDMKGHLTLKARGATDDLKCILRGISQDLPVRISELEAAATPKARDTALKEMSYLLNDNVEVITAPPTPPA